MKKDENFRDGVFPAQPSTDRWGIPLGHPRPIKREPWRRMTLDDLRAFAIERHGSQMYGDLPYSAHLDAVVALAQHYDLGTAYVRAAYGHDLLDDTKTHLNELFATFGMAEADLIWAVSSEGGNRVARTKSTIRRLNQDKAGVNLKMVDRMANLRASIDAKNPKLVAMYVEEAPLYQPLFEQGHPELYKDLKTLYSTAKEYLASGK